MTNWIKTIKIRHLMTEEEDIVSVRKSMNNIADVLEKHLEFRALIPKFRNIPDGNDVITPCDYANKLLEKMYDIADEMRIWID